MLKFDHLALPVADCKASRDWYVGTLCLSVEFEISDLRKRCRRIAVADRSVPKHDAGSFRTRDGERAIVRRRDA